MANVLYLNYPKSPDGLEQATFGDFAATTSYGVDQDAPEAEKIAADGIISGSANHDVGDVNQYPNCKIIVRMGVGYDNLDSKAWGARGVPVCNVPDYGTSEVADHAVSLMLTLARGTPLLRHQARRRSRGQLGLGARRALDAPAARADLRHHRPGPHRHGSRPARQGLRHGHHVL